MRRSLMKHLSDDIIEAYALSAPSEANGRDVEEHFRVCETCRAKLTRAEEEIELIRLAWTEPQVHYADGAASIRISVEVQGDRASGKIDGPGPCHLFEAKTPGAAMAAAVRAFRRMYPSHVCDERCSRREPGTPGGN